MELDSENLIFTEKIEREVMVIGAMALENEEISANDLLLTHII